MTKTANVQLIAVFVLVILFFGFVFYLTPVK